MNSIGVTKAAVLFATGNALKIVDLRMPELQPGQLLIKVAYSGICHSQLNEIKGLKGPDRFLPHTLGHEGAGTVISVGDGVKKARVGDHVVMSWLKGSGADVPATIYVG